MTNKYLLQRAVGVLPSLDSVGNNRNGFCGRSSIKGILDERPNYSRYVRMVCKQWKCPRCGPKRVRQLKAAIIKRATELGLSNMITLTLDPRTCAADESVVYIRKCWDKFRTTLKRKHGESITFITVLEFQKSGYAHLHILVNRYIAQKWLSGAWQAVGGGRIVDIRHVDIHRIPAYLSKYLTKEMLLSTVNRKYRRFTTSRDMVLMEKPKFGGKWALLSLPIEFLYQKHQKTIIQEKKDFNNEIQWFEIGN